MTDTAAPPAPIVPAPAGRRWRVTLAKPALLFGEWLSPSHDGIEVDDHGLALLADAVATKTELVPPGGLGG